MKKVTSIFILFLFFVLSKTGYSQINGHHLVGYWHNWNAYEAPFIELNQVDNRYDIICLAFAIPVSSTDMTMTFNIDGMSEAMLISQITEMQQQGKKVLISIGGATGMINLPNENSRQTFVASMNTLIDYYGFDGVDIDIEHGDCISISGGTITNPGNVAQQNFISAMFDIMLHYRNTFGKKMFLTAAPETAYIQGGMSAFGGIWGGYLPLVEGLRDSLDILYVQLYNSGTVYGIDGNVYTQGTADFIVALTEAAIQGFNTSGGYFYGLPAKKVAVGLPACSSAAGGGYTDTAVVKTAMDYLLGIGPKPENYSLIQADGYPDLCGMMTWSINWDAVQNCNGSYAFAENYERIFGDAPIILSNEKKILSFSISNQIGSTDINEQNHTITILMPFGTDITNLIPAITVSNLAVVTPENGVNQDFTNDVVYIVTAEDQSTQYYTVHIDVSNISSDMNFVSNMILYPNPNKGAFSVSDNNVEEIEIYDLQGKCIEKINTNGNINIVTNLHSGVYIMKIVVNSNSYFEKLVIEK